MLSEPSSGTFEHLVYHMQAASIALGIFVCFWGLSQFWRCLWEVLAQKPLNHRLCPYHAGAAMVCIVGIIFGLARASTLQLVPFGPVFSGLLFTAGMFGFTFIMGLAIWAKDFSHAVSPFHDARYSHPQLGRIFNMVLIIIGAFVLVGLVRASMSG